MNRPKCERFLKWTDGTTDDCRPIRWKLGDRKVSPLLLRYSSGREASAIPSKLGTQFSQARRKAASRRRDSLAGSRLTGQDRSRSVGNPGDDPQGVTEAESCRPGRSNPFARRQQAPPRNYGEAWLRRHCPARRLLSVPCSSDTTSFPTQHGVPRKRKKVSESEAECHATVARL